MTTLIAAVVWIVLAFIVGTIFGRIAAFGSVAETARRPMARRLRSTEQDRLKEEHDRNILRRLRWEMRYREKTGHWPRQPWREAA